MKTCKSGCGNSKMKMSKGGPKVTAIKKMAAGGIMIPLAGNNPMTYSGRQVKNGGQAGLPICKGGLVRRADGKCGTRETPAFKKGGATKNEKLAAVAKPKNKITRADVLTRILKKKKNNG
jgi:hypothetical protein